MMAELLTAAVLSLSLNTPHYDMVPKDFDANLKFRQKMLVEAGNDSSSAKQMLTLCAEDILFYINTFCWTYSPKDSVSSYPITPFITYEFQDEAISEIVGCILGGRDGAIAKSRDMGASWMGLTVIEWFWHFRDYQSFLMISRKEDLVDKKGDPVALFWKIDFLHKNQPRWLLPTGRWLGDKDSNRKLLHLGNADNGSVIDGESTTENLSVGDRRTALFIDEFGTFAGSEGYSVLRGTRDVTNCRLFNSTPRGQNAFYEVVKKTNAKTLHLHWSRHPLKSRGLYKVNESNGQVELLDNWCGEVKVLGEDGAEAVVKFPEEYPFILDIDDVKFRSPWYDYQCSRCVSPQEIAQELDIDFQGSDFPFFEPRFINILIKKYCRSPLLVGELDFDRETLKPKAFIENKHGNLFLWVNLNDKGFPATDRNFVLGSDVSAGTGASNSVSCVVDRKTGEKVGVLRTSRLCPTPFADVSIALSYFFNKAFMVWDASGPTGKVFTQQVVKHSYGNIYYRRNEKKISQEITDEPGYFLNPKAREALLEDYRSSLACHSYINRSESGMEECKQFIRKPDGTIEHSASVNAVDPSGARTAHGDEVVADALANHGLSSRKQEDKSKEPQIPVGSLAWRQKLKAEAEANKKKDVLGDGW